MKNKKDFFESVSDLTMKIAEPIAAFTEKPWISAIRNGMVATMPLLIIGSFFLVLAALGRPWIGGTGLPLLPFLAPYSEDILNLFRFTMGFVGLYVVVAIAMSYAAMLKINEMTAGLLALATFFLMTLDSTTLTGTVKDAAGIAIEFSIGGIRIGSFGAAGMFAAIIVALSSVKIYKFIVDKKMTIRMPEGVPPNIGNAFTALIPYTAIFALAWVIRTLLNFDLPVWLTTILQPVFHTADNIVMFTLRMTLGNLFWFFGLHGDMMLAPVVNPFIVAWMAENSAAMAAGLPLPFIWVEPLMRMSGWTATVWPLMILMFMSKVRHHRTLALTALPAGIFTIIEPIMFGLPLALNPILMVPFLLSTVVSSIVTYGAVLIGFVDRFFALLPWATPPFILGPAASGDIMWVVVVALNVVIGFVIFYPFFKVFERAELKRIEEKRIEENK